MEHPFLALDRPGSVRAIAHRGGGGPRENTLAAFSAAVTLGYRHLETDVHVTRDGTLVISHDATLARVAGDPRPIAELTRAELSRVRVAGSEPVPAFEEFVDAFPDARLTVDLKCDAAVAPMARLLERRPELLQRMCLGSFSSARVETMRQQFGPALMTAATPREIARFVAAARLRRRPPRIAAGCIAIPQRYPETRFGLRVGNAALSEAALDAGYAVHVWTINDAPRMQSLLDAGVSGIVTDELVLLRNTLTRAARW